MIRVLIVDDHLVFAEALSLALNAQRDMRVSGIATSGPEAVQRATQEPVDVVLMDYQLPGMNGARATEAIKRVRPQTRVVMLTSLAEEHALIESMAAGASGFVDKSRAIYDVVMAVRAAHRGEALVPSAALPRLLAELAAAKRAAQQRAIGGLTPREYEVLQALARGESQQAIAERLVISPQTVATHVRNILSKLGVHSKLEAVTHAIRIGLIDPPR